MFGQIPDFSDGFEFLRKLWGNAAAMQPGMMPGMQAMAPPMSLEEIDKRIHDLKAVESWLQLNTSMLRTTIQGLEVQRATLVALQTFGNALSPEAMQAAMENVARAANAPSAAPPRRPADTFSAAPAPEPDEPDVEEDDDMPDDAMPDDRDDADVRARGGDDDTGADAGQRQAGAGPEVPPHAGLWWDMLQQQFSQVASTAAAASLASLGNLGNLGGMGGTPPFPSPPPGAAAGSPTTGSNPGKAAKPAGSTRSGKAPAGNANPAKGSKGTKAAPAGGTGKPAGSPETPARTAKAPTASKSAARSRATRRTEEPENGNGPEDGSRDS